MLKYENYQLIDTISNSGMATYILLNRCLGLHCNNKLELQTAVYKMYGEFIEVNVLKVHCISYYNLLFESIIKLELKFAEYIVIIDHLTDNFIVLLSKKVTKTANL